MVPFKWIDLLSSPQMGKWASIDMIPDSVMDVCDGKTRATWGQRVLSGKQKIQKTVLPELFKDKAISFVSLPILDSQGLSSFFF